MSLCARLQVLLAYGKCVALQSNAQAEQNMAREWAPWVQHATQHTSGEQAAMASHAHSRALGIAIWPGVMLHDEHGTPGKSSVMPSPMQRCLNTACRLTCGSASRALALLPSSSCSSRRLTSGAGGATLGGSSQRRSAQRCRMRSSSDAVAASVGAGGGRTAVSKSRSTSSALLSGRDAARPSALHL